MLIKSQVREVENKITSTEIPTRKRGIDNICVTNQNRTDYETILDCHYGGGILIVTRFNAGQWSSVAAKSDVIELGDPRIAIRVVLTPGKIESSPMEEVDEYVYLRQVVRSGRSNFDSEGTPRFSSLEQHSLSVSGLARVDIVRVLSYFVLNDFAVPGLDLAHILDSDFCPTFDSDRGFTSRSRFQFRSRFQQSILLHHPTLPQS
ncbi:hypothetical protein EVAR_98971_1 [Eumeta japonica]|uniref:Uncharacterized protein n=1 Tax=Eumeta variegata TaxID=151549 RepID=A0A4C1YMY9_EUMVA|nr:hypothetical protein EVAR_98971_1 [Eumeta japonica]